MTNHQQTSHRFRFSVFLASSISIFAANAWSADNTLAAPAVPWPTSGWQESTPEQQGMGSDALLRLVDFGAKNDVDSVLVVRHGKLVLDTYYAPYRADLKHLINSTTKAVVGTLTGMAVKDGVLKSVNLPVMDFFSDQTIANLDANKKAIRIENLLDLNSGMEWKEPLSNEFPESLFQMRASPNWTALVLDKPMAAAPGTAFNYNSGTWQLMSAILTKATGTSTADYAKQKLFGPLGISDVQWDADPQGISTGGFGLYMHPRDMAKIGYLYLHNGEWQGKALLSPEWTDKVFHHASVDMHLGNSPAFHYANGWWTIPDRNVIMAVGFHRQLIVVLPKLDMVAVLTGKTHYPFGPLIDLLEASAVADHQLPANSAAFTELGNRVRDVATEKASVVPPASPLASKISGRVYQFEHNRMGMKTLTLDLTGTNPHYELVSNFANRVVTRTGPIGLDGLFRTSIETDGPRAVKASWTDASTLSMVSQTLSEGVVSRYTLHFSDNTIDVAFSENTGFKAEFHGTYTP